MSDILDYYKFPRETLSIGNLAPPNIIFHDGDMRLEISREGVKLNDELVENTHDAIRVMYEARRRTADEVTEEMCYRARGFILGLQLEIRNWGEMQNHLDSGGYFTCKFIQDAAREAPQEHISKENIARCIYMLMTGAK